ncbi:MAG: hypothetical protein AB1558_02540 [Thermodesulfobacteriota bacterium]
MSSLITVLLSVQVSTRKVIVTCPQGVVGAFPCLTSAIGFESLMEYHMALREAAVIRFFLMMIPAFRGGSFLSLS